jgi:hypothetical protein
MSESPYARPVEDMVGDVRVPVSEQVAEQAVPRLGVPDGGSGVVPYGDGMSGDADGD